MLPLVKIIGAHANTSMCYTQLITVFKMKI